MGGILDFLFGKDANVFDENGRVRHQFPDKKWSDWNNRFQKNSDYDWRNHSAQEAASKTPGKTPGQPETEKK
jgi:hypothetical protein